MKIKHCIFKTSGSICRIISLLLIATTLFSCANSSNCYAQDTKGTFFGPISCGDNLEKCIQNGWVQHTGGETAWLWYDWKLTDSNITSHFPRAGVVFDSRNTIQEIHLISTNLNRYAPHDDTEGAFNYMLQYFCQQYKGMKKKDVYEKIDECRYKSGVEYSWSTQFLNIRLRHYTLAHNDNACTESYCIDYSISGGTYAEVFITKK